MTRPLTAIFTEVAGTYELVNRVLTLGMDTGWRKKAAMTAVSRGGRMFLDVCTGTGETASELKRFAVTGSKIVAVDFTPKMIAAARKRRDVNGVSFVLADVDTLPFPDGMFDAVTVSFATRNINRDRVTLVRRFREIRRVLKPGGIFINVETSQPPSKIIRMLFHLYVRLTVKPVGYLLSGSKAGYSYLAYTIQRFYDAGELTRLLREGGFEWVTWRRMLFGAVAVHIAEKRSANM